MYFSPTSPLVLFPKDLGSLCFAMECYLNIHAAFMSQCDFSFQYFLGN